MTREWLLLLYSVLAIWFDIGFLDSNWPFDSKHRSSCAKDTSHELIDERSTHSIVYFLMFVCYDKVDYVKPM